MAKLLLIVGIALLLLYPVLYGGFLGIVYFGECNHESLSCAKLSVDGVLLFKSGFFISEVLPFLLLPLGFSLLVLGVLATVAQRYFAVMKESGSRSKGR
jgi:hypothetical protein